jgi:hypothetical protein
MNSTESLCGICFQDEGNDPKAHTCNVLCGACGQFFGEEEMDSEGHHNSEDCSEGQKLVECVECFSDFDPMTEGKIHDKFNSPNLGGAVVAFCGKCWKFEFSRRNGGK